MKYEIHVLPEKLVNFRVRDNDANSSAPTRETTIRVSYEFYKLLQTYRGLVTFADLVKVFPSAARFYRGTETDMEFALAMVALEKKRSTSTQLFGLDLLFEIISDPQRAIALERLYEFDYDAFVGLTANP
jgi:hypothetical protein